MSKRRALGLAAIVIGFVVLLVVKRHELIRFGLEQAVRVTTGYSLQLDDQRLGTSHGAFIGVHVSRGGDSVLDAKRIDLYYSLRDLLPGSRHRFGLTSIAIDAPEVTLLRHADGRLNIILPNGASTASAPSVVPGRPNPVPLRFTVRVRGGSGVVIDTAPFGKNQSVQRMHDIVATMTVDSSARTHYVVTGAFEEPRKSLVANNSGKNVAGVINPVDEPFRAIGTVDELRGYAVHRIQAAAVPVRTIGNFIINSPAAQILAGTARNFDARIYALDVVPNAPIDYHIGARLDVHGARLFIETLAKPLEAIDGRLQIVDNVFFARHLDARLSGIPVQIAGGIFDFANPQLRFAATGNGDLQQLRSVLAFSAKEPVRGDAKVGFLVYGPTSAPLLAIHGTARRVFYGGIPLDNLETHLAIGMGMLYIAPLRVDYGGAPIAAHGTLTFNVPEPGSGTGGTAVASELAIHVNANSDRLPYLDELIGNEPIAGDVLLRGTGTALSAHGVVASTRDINRIGGMFAFDPNGATSIAPLYVDTGAGTFMAEFHMSQPHGASKFWAVAQNLTLHAPQAPAFPGAPLPQIPPISGKLLYAAVVGGGMPSSGHSGGAPDRRNGVVIAGRGEIAGAQIAHVPFASLIATFSGDLADASINSLHADGPWGSFDGLGSFSTQQIVARGSYAGTLKGLEPFLGGLDASGALSGPVAIAISNHNVVVQARSVQFGPGAQVHGVPVQRASGTIAYSNGRLRVYTANARIANGSLVAAGSFTPQIRNSSDKLHVVGVELRGAGLHGLGIPLESGEVAVSGTVGSNADGANTGVATNAASSIPSFDGGVSLRNGKSQGYAVQGTALLGLHGDAVRVDHAVGALGASYAIVRGTVTALNSHVPQYALHASVPAADVVTTLDALRLPTYASEGVFNGELDISGSTANPKITGMVGVPGGSLNGLPFIDARAAIEADPRGLRVRHGKVLVGSTQVAFFASARERVNSFGVSSTHAVLSDFDNYFDTGDTLDGTGFVNVAIVAGERRFVTHGNVNVANLRYRSLPIGNTYAFWQSRQSVVRGSVAIGGTHGRFAAAGSIALAPTQHWNRLVTRSRYNVNASLQHLDLSTWLPAFGYPTVPLFGRVDATARIVGTYPRIALTGDAHLLDGSFARLPIDTFTASVRTTGGNIRLESAQLEASGISANATGNVQLGKHMPIALEVHASTSDLPQVVARVAKVTLDVKGTFETTVNIGGTLGDPTFKAAFDAEDVNAYGVVMPSLFGALRLQGKNLELSNAGVSFTKGETTLAGTLPLRLMPFEVARNQPVSFDLDLQDVNPSTFQTLFGNNTQLGGDLNGHIGIAGTIQAPRIYGRITLQKGTYLSNLERVSITNTIATVTFDRTSATLDQLTANLGRGRIQGNGNIAFPHGFGEFGDVDYAIHATAKGAQLNLPAYGSGTIDATLAFTRTPPGLAQLSGMAAASDAVIPFAAFLAAPQTGGAAPVLAGIPLNFGLALDIEAGKNVRVRGGGYGAGLDIGATGKAHLAGTLVAPTLAGRFDSTGGTLTYFDRAFKVQSGYVAFNPADGIVPELHATAVTHVVNPDPDVARNPTGSADITIKVNGSLSHLNIAFSAEPAGYSREQILALIAPFGGFATGINFNGATATSLPGQQNPLPGQVATPTGQVLPPGAVQNVNGTLTVGQEAFNILNAQFTAGLLAPLEGALGQGLGLQNLSFTLGYNGDIGLNLRRQLGRYVSAVYTTSFGIPQISSFGVSYAPSESTAAQLSFFVENGPTRLFDTPYVSATNNLRTTLGQAIVGQSGFSFTLQRLFK